MIKRILLNLGVLAFAVFALCFALATGNFAASCISGVAVVFALLGIYFRIRHD